MLFDWCSRNFNHTFMRVSKYTEHSYKIDLWHTTDTVTYTPFYVKSPKSHSVCSEQVLVTSSPVSYSSRGNYNLLVHSDTRKNLSRYWMVSSTIRGGGFIFKRRFSLRRLQIYEFQMYVEKKFEGKVHVNFCTIKCWKLVKNGIK